MSSSFFERVIVIIETCLVVSSLRRDIIVRLQNHRAHMEIQHYPENKKKKATYGSRPSSNGSHISVISVDPVVVF